MQRTKVNRSLFLEFLHVTPGPKRGALKLQDWTLQDRTKTDEFARVYIAGLGIDVPDNEGPIVTKLPKRCRYCQRINS